MTTQLRLLHDKSIFYLCNRACVKTHKFAYNLNISGFDNTEKTYLECYCSLEPSSSYVKHKLLPRLTRKPQMFAEKARVWEFDITEMDKLADFDLFVFYGIWNGNLMN